MPMKISETSWGKFAIVEWIECRLTTKSKSEYAKIMKDNLWFYEIDNHGFYRDSSCECILISPLCNKIEKKMRALGYTDFDYDSKPYALVKCYK